MTQRRQPRSTDKPTPTTDEGTEHAAPAEAQDGAQDEAPAPRWWRWEGPYPIVLCARGIEVTPFGEPVQSDDGPPTTAPEWQPADPPKEG